MVDGFAKTWKYLALLLVLAAAGLVGWEKWTQSPNRDAGYKHAETGDRTDEGQIVRAVQLYRRAAINGDSRAIEAAEQLKALLDDWLCAHEEGRGKLAKMLAAEGRGYDILMFVGQMLRESGAQAEARSLIEEAYGKEADNARRFAAAAARAQLAMELDDRIFWLRRASPQDVQVQANLCEAQGEKAFQDGQQAEAATQLRQAIALYARMPVNAAVLNNGALVHMSLYRVTGERPLLEKAQSMMDNAVVLDPRNSILLNNAVDALLDTAVRDVIGNTIDLKMLKKSGDYSLLAYLYADQAGKRLLTERVRTHPAAVKATFFLERLLVLSPKSPGIYHHLRVHYAAQRNADKLRDLMARLEKAEPDLTAQEKTMRDYFAGKKDELIRKELEAPCDRYAKLVKETEPGRRGITYAVAATELATLKMTLDRVGKAANAGEVVALVESAHAAAPSDATRRALEVALLFRASRNLAQKDLAFAALVSRTHRSLESKDHIAAALMREGAMRQTVLADADVKRALELVRDSRRQFPDDPSKWAWVMLRSADAEEAARLAKVIRDDPTEAVLRVIDWKLSPFSAGIALRTCWSLQVAGKDQEGASILKQCAARGTPMPDLP
ncbi:MAG TPA: hypothetical protein VH575_02325 [Gemmataceae bacterium]